MEACGLWEATQMVSCDGTTTDRETPVQIETSGVTSVSAGIFTQFICQERRELVGAMGYNNYGQLGDGTTTDRDTPVQIETSG